MGKRYGGRYSPPGHQAGAPKAGAPALPGGPLANRRARRTSLRARLLFLLPTPLLFAGIGATLRGSPIEAVVELGGYAALMLAAWLTNEGLRAEAAFEARTVARPPALPRKLVAMALTGLTIATLGALSLGQGLIGGIVFGALAAGAHLVSFGPDPLKSKGVPGDDFTTERVVRAVDEAEAVIRDISAAAARFGDRRLEGRVETLCGQARDVLRAIERDPRDLSRARRFLSVYLVGLRDATVKFADLWSRNRETTARAQYESLLADLETSFAAKRVSLLEDNRGDLEIEIAVLRERLEQDGLIAR
jgi:hypothetical protein